MKIYLIAFLLMFAINTAYADDTTLTTIVNVVIENNNVPPGINPSNYEFAICSSNTGAFGHNCGSGQTLTDGSHNYTDSVPNSHNYLPSIEFPVGVQSAKPMAEITLAGNCSTGEYQLWWKLLVSTSTGDLYEVKTPITNPKNGTNHTFSMTATVTGFTNDITPLPEITLSQCSFA